MKEGDTDPFAVYDELGGESDSPADDDFDPYSSPAIKMGLAILHKQRATIRPPSPSPESEQAPTADQKFIADFVDRIMALLDSAFKDPDTTKREKKEILEYLKDAECLQALRRPAMNYGILQEIVDLFDQEPKARAHDPEIFTLLHVKMAGHDEREVHRLLRLLDG